MRFWFHYNKPASKQAGKPVLTFHHKGKCTLVNNVDVAVHTRGHINKRQPFFVMKGDAEEIYFVDRSEGLVAVVPW